MLSKIVTGFFGCLIVCASSSIAGYFYAKKSVEDVARIQMSKLVAVVSPFGRLEYGKIVVKPLTPSIEIKNLKFQPYNKEEFVQIESIKVDKIDYKSLYQIANQEQAMVKSLRWTLTGLALPPSVFSGPETKFLQDAGYSQINFSASAGFAFAPEQEQFDITDLWIEAENLGKLSINISFGNFPFPSLADIKNLQNNPTAAQMFAMKYLAANVRSFRFEFTDKSLTSRLRYAYYKSSGQDILVQTRMLMEENSRMPASSKFEKRTKEALFSFISTPTTLSFIVQPQHPVPLLRLSSLMQSNADLISEEIGASWEVSGKKY